MYILAKKRQKTKAMETIDRKPRRTRRRKRNSQNILLFAIAVLAIVLFGVASIAMSLSGGEEPSETAGGLTVSASLENGSVTVLETVSFSGSAGTGLTLNGAQVTAEEDGSFSITAGLSVGENRFTFQYGGESVVYTYQRQYALISCSPEGDASYASGDTIYLTVTARTGSTVTAELDGTVVTLSASGSGQEDAPEGCTVYTGTYVLPSWLTEDVVLGAITYSAEYDGVAETEESGNITCLAQAGETEATGETAAPSSVNYIDVGTGYIAEVVNGWAETFDGDTTDDYSHPTNSYLPEGTVDYCASQTIVNGQLTYIQLRCGRRIYADTTNIPSTSRVTVAECYSGTLPDHNEIGVVSMTEQDNHTVLVLDCLWKAPFYFEILPQTYAAPNGGSERNYSITSFTATYVDITFCYATSFSGTVQIPEDNPLFSSAQVIRNESDYTLRLYLKETGGFYGWDSAYNEQGQLCFYFLNPAQVTEADNAYGADLTGVTIMLDVGHGGVDGGATGVDSSGERWSESGRNLALAQAIRTELESMGATVVMNREDGSALLAIDRVKMLKELAPDLCIAVHHNSVDNFPDASGFECFYYTPFSMTAAKLIYESTKSAGIYSSSLLNWHVYYVARQTVCPVVLTENGYMSNLSDLNGTLSSSVITQKAQAIAQGVADYFLSLRR